MLSFFSRASSRALPPHPLAVICGRTNLRHITVPQSVTFTDQAPATSNMSKPELQKQNKQFGGWNKRFKHASKACGCDMLFTVYFPPQTSKGKVPIVYYLSGLSCTDENFIQKSGGQRKAAELGVAVVCPDTSPRGLNIEGEDESWDFGSGAGFYLNATQPKWQNYRMYEYITEELPATLQHFSELDTHKASIMGHSMGGHGALIIGIKNHAKYKSISAFAPICNPSQVPWGKKAFSGYLGHDQSQWKQYDAVELLGDYSGPQLEVLVDVGTDDNFLKEQLEPEALKSAAQGKLKLELRMQEGYDHSYFTIGTFVDSHIALHAKHLTS